MFDGGTLAGLASFFAYDPSFRGGVRVAVAEIGDAPVKVVFTAPGPGGGPHIRAFGVDGAPLPVNFLAYDAFPGGVFIDGIRK